MQLESLYALASTVILSAAKDPDTAHIPTAARTFLPRILKSLPEIIRSISQATSLKLTIH